MALLEIKDLSLDIGPYSILKDIDLTVDAGEIVGVIGESGSGKSITALTVMQLLPLGATTKGSVKLEGREVLGLPDAEMRKIRGKLRSKCVEPNCRGADPTLFGSVRVTCSCRCSEKQTAMARSWLAASRPSRGRTSRQWNRLMNPGNWSAGTNNPIIQSGTAGPV